MIFSTKHRYYYLKFAKSKKYLNKQKNFLEPLQNELAVAKNIIESLETSSSIPKILLEEKKQKINLLEQKIKDL